MNTYAAFVIGFLVGLGAGLTLCGVILYDLGGKIRKLERRNDWGDGG